MQNLSGKSIISLQKLPDNERIFALTFQDNDVKEYLRQMKTISVKDLEYIPYLRFLMAREFEHQFNIKTILYDILNDYETGAILIRFNLDLTRESAIQLATAIAYLLGVPSLDPLSGKYYATFTIKHTEDQLPNLLRSYETFKMHTDGAYLHDVPDWILFMKLTEINAEGGKSRLLHLEDWFDFDDYYLHPTNKNGFLFFSSPDSILPNKRFINNQNVFSPILKVNASRKSIRFVDRFILPSNFEEAEFIFELQNSLERASEIRNISIPVGSLLVINNHHWLHGRQSFQLNHALTRELMRQRGKFVN